MIKGSYENNRLYLLVFILLALFFLILINVYNSPLNSSLFGDSKIMYAFYAIRSPMLSPLMLFITFMGEWYSIAVLALISMAFLIKKNKTRLASALFVSVFGGEAIVLLIKNFIQRARPDVVPRLAAESGYGFPSAHSLVAISFYGLGAYFLFRSTKKKAAKITFATIGVLIILLMGASRIYLGVHWPSDVLGSYLLGSAWVLSIIIYLDYKREFN